MRRVFADTAFYLAILNPRDQYAAVAAQFSGEFDGTILTTSAVLTEVANGLARTRQRSQISALWKMLDADPDVDVIHADTSLWLRALELYSERDDKEWSLTDCLSFIVMGDAGLTEALTADHHFTQAGFTILM
jgi:predicted nucleic acid-binding protein